MKIKSLKYVLNLNATAEKVHINSPRTSRILQDIGMKIDNNKLLKLLVILLLFLTNQHVWAIDFKTEQEKGVWIKNFFKDKELAPMEYPIKATEEEKKFKLQIINDFITQNGFEHIEPIARGKSLSDPEIAKFNKACPDKKPIDMYKWWPTLFSYEDSAEKREKILEDPDNNYEVVVDIYRCNGNMKIYQFNLYNISAAKEEYVLYCDDLRGVRTLGKTRDINRKIKDSSIEGAYLHFDPEKCLYSDKLITTYPFWGDAVTGIVKYQKKYYIYTIEGCTNGTVSIWLESQNGISNAKYYGTKTKEIIK